MYIFLLLSSEITCKSVQFLINLGSTSCLALLKCLYFLIFCYERLLLLYGI